MRTYAVTMLSTIILCYLAEQYDDPMIDTLDESRVRHSGSALFFFLLASSVLILVSGLRYRVGADYLSYYYGYSSYIRDLPHTLRTLDEPGFGVLSWIATRFVNNGEAAMFAASLVTIGLCLIVIYRHTDRLLFSTFLFVAMGCWHGSFNGIRQYLATAILFCGYKYLKERRFFKYLLIVLLATMFHRSSIVMIALFFAVYREINVKNLLITIALAGVILFSFERVIRVVDIIMDKNYNPEGGYTSKDVNILRVMAACLPAVVFLIAYWGKELTRQERFFLNITIIHAALRIYTMNSALLYRIGIYTTPFMLIAIPELLKGISDNNRKMISGGISLMFFIMWWYEISGSSNLLPFQWIFNK